ncbi:hypothetical protein G647_00441 [Cladophialophora carrionii CBS 160.54]|uniref:DUF6594 domain-containing protein n=1 Tax=Cladophialophora carrionii CBS 160.54 TaxID=1279043 RepID=V9DPW2_9EURO|nr:uncharacterized protein G647_00441 [Cladophialophora carrionii CBS 160.54]ETI27992.1 hypothetical protein G647_00441 [Cladophialophora carrionii CBS 160.54]
MADEEKGAQVQQYLTGFGSFANVISSDSDHATAVYKTFDKLAARDLLYYQAELLELEALQDRYDREDAADVPKLDSFSPEWVQIRQNTRNWSSFKQSSQEPSAIGARWKGRTDLAMQIRAKLGEYREALIANAKVLSLSPPSKQTMTALSRTFHQRLSSFDDPSETDAVLMGHGGASNPDRPRLAEVHPEPDFLTYILKTYCSRLFKVRRRAPSHGPTHLSSPEVRHYSIERINFAALFITTVLSALPIYVLYHMSSGQPGLTLGLIALFTCLFVGTVALVTNARRAEIFGSCAAYAAVLVVFVSGDFANGSPVGPND